MIGGRRQLKGRKSGDRRVRVERPHSPYFRYAGPGSLVAREAASIPRTPTGRAVARHWWDRLLYNQTAKRLKAELVGREHTVIADVPYRRGH